MDLGAAADGIAQAYLAFMFFGSIAIHALAVFLAILGLVFGGRAAQVCSLLAIILVVANHIGLVYLGAWKDVVWNPATIWTAVFLAAAGLVGTVVLRFHTLQEVLADAADVLELRAAKVEEGAAVTVPLSTVKKELELD